MGNLAKHYSTARLQGRLSGNEVSFSENKVFTEEDIEAAFNAGRESVVENMPKLRWENVFEDGPYIAFAYFDASYKIEFSCNEFNLFRNNMYIGRYISLLAAKQAANDDYKKRIKQALGL